MAHSSEGVPPAPAGYVGTELAVEAELTLAMGKPST
jgi:hypothetical protein